MKKVDTEKLNEIFAKNFDGIGREITSDVIIQSNGAIKHIQKKHPNDWEKYGDRLFEIITVPDYIGANPKENHDIEFYKTFGEAGSKDIVFVALRRQKNKEGEETGALTLSTLYKLDNADAKIANRLRNGRIIKLEWISMMIC